MEQTPPLRPRDLALLLLAVCDLPPRARARDQRPDLSGLALKRQLLDRLAALDPEPNQLDDALARAIDELGPPTGPVRALAREIHDEWQAVCTQPDWLGFLLFQATRQEDERSRG